MAFTDEKKKRNTDKASIVANICGVSPDYVRKVIKGERNNEGVLRAYMTYDEGHNKLVDAVKKIVPFNN